MGIEEKIDALTWELVFLIIMVLVIVYSMYEAGMLYFPGISGTSVPESMRGKKSNFMAYTIQGTNPLLGRDHRRLQDRWHIPQPFHGLLIT